MNVETEVKSVSYFLKTSCPQGVELERVVKAALEHMKHTVYQATGGKRLQDEDVRFEFCFSPDHETNVTAFARVKK